MWLNILTIREGVLLVNRPSTCSELSEGSFTPGAQLVHLGWSVQYHQVLTFNSGALSLGHTATSFRGQCGNDVNIDTQSTTQKMMQTPTVQRNRTHSEISEEIIAEGLREASGRGILLGDPSETREVSHAEGDRKRGARYTQD